MGLRRPLSSAVNAGSRNTGGRIGVVSAPREGGLVAIRQSEARSRSVALARSVRDLETLLVTGLGRDPHVAVGDWRAPPTRADLPPELREPAEPRAEDFLPPPLTLLERLTPGGAARHADAVAAGKAAHAKARTDWEAIERRRAAELDRLTKAADAENRRLEALEAKLGSGDREIAPWYARRVLDLSPYPAALTREIETGFRGDSRDLDLRIRIPGLADIIPAVEHYRWNKQRGEMVEVKRAPEDRSALYQSVVAQFALRSLHEVFTTDDARAIDTVILRLRASEIDPGVGRPAARELAWVRLGRDAFAELDLGRVDPIACLERLKSRGADTPLT